MKKTISGVVVAAVVLSACGGAGGGSVAATVGDTEFTVGDVRAFPYEAEGTIDQTTFAQYLSALIQWEIVDQAAAAEFEINPTEAETAAELETVLEEQTGGLTLAEVAQQQQIAEDIIRRLVRVGLIQRLVATELGEDVGDPTAEEIAAAVADAEVGLTEVCVRHLLVATADEAGAAKARLDGGEEFATVAAEVSTDPSAATNGGDLDCAPAGDYVDEFRDAAVAAEIDAVTEPVESEFGFHVLQVYERTEPAAADLPTEEEVRQTLVEEAGSVALQEWLTAKVEAADVTVEEEFGTWSLEPQPGVQPPAT